MPQFRGGCNKNKSIFDIFAKTATPIKLIGKVIV